MNTAAYEANAMAQAAEERKFEIIGEALNQLGKVNAALEQFKLIAGDLGTDLAELV